MTAPSLSEGELSDWAKPGHELPGALSLVNDSGRFERLKKLGDYYTIGSLSLALCEDDDGYKWRNHVKNTSGRVWDRLITMHHTELDRDIKSIRSEKGYHNNPSSKSRRISGLRNMAIFRDDVLYDTAIDTDRMDKICHGMDGVARYGLPYLLLMEGGHEDM